MAGWCGAQMTLSPSLAPTSSVSVHGRWTVPSAADGPVRAWIAIGADDVFLMLGTESVGLPDRGVVAIVIQATLYVTLWRYSSAAESTRLATGGAGFEVYVGDTIDAEIVVSGTTSVTINVTNVTSDTQAGWSGDIGDYVPSGAGFDLTDSPRIAAWVVGPSSVDGVEPDPFSPSPPITAAFGLFGKVLFDDGYCVQVGKGKDAETSTDHPGDPQHPLVLGQMEDSRGNSLASAALRPALNHVNIIECQAAYNDRGGMDLIGAQETVTAGEYGWYDPTTQTEY